MCYIVWVITSLLNKLQIKLKSDWSRGWSQSICSENYVQKDPQCPPNPVSIIAHVDLFSVDWKVAVPFKEMCSISPRVPVARPSGGRTFRTWHSLSTVRTALWASTPIRNTTVRSSTCVTRMGVASLISVPTTLASTRNSESATGSITSTATRRHNGQYFTIGNTNVGTPIP